MLSFYAFHPLDSKGIEKVAAFPSVTKSMKTYWDAMAKMLGSARKAAIPSKLTAAGLVGGGAYGINSGNEQHASQIPPVRALPKLNAEEFVLPDSQPLYGAQ